MILGRGTFGRAEEVRKYQGMLTGKGLLLTRSRKSMRI